MTDGTKTIDIILCVSCRGKGTVAERESFSSTKQVTCKRCVGSGRLKVIKTVEVIAYDGTEG